MGVSELIICYCEVPSSTSIAINSITSMKGDRNALVHNQILHKQNVWAKLQVPLM